MASAGVFDRLLSVAAGALSELVSGGGPRNGKLGDTAPACVKGFDVDPRFDRPLYTRAEVALHLGLPATTLGDWLRSGALAAGSGGRGEPTITFAGLVETHMLRQLRRTGLSLQAIGEAAVALRSRAGSTRWPGPGLRMTVAIC
ncbi:hypothetical protein GCM10029976_063700 [Kribbella albertanoniae]